MRLNPDCVRDILLTVEEKCDFSSSWFFDSSKPPDGRLKKYDAAEIAYHLRQCKMSELITAGKFYGQGGNLIVTDLTPAGHEFLENIRKDTVWNKVKSIAIKNVGSCALSALMSIAQKVVEGLISSHFSI